MTNQLECRTSKNQERQSYCEHHGSFGIPGFVTFQVLPNNLIEVLVLSHNQYEYLHEQYLNIWKKKDRNEGKAKDHEDKDEIQDEEKQSVVLVDESHWGNIVSQNTQSYQHYCYY